MRLCWIVEGDAEYESLPTLADRMGHSTIGILNICGSFEDWLATIRGKVLPRARSLAIKRPDKLLVVMDREDRSACAPELAASGLVEIQNALRSDGTECPVSIIVCNKQFECLLFADFELADKLEIFCQPISSRLGTSTEGRKLRSAITDCLKPGRKYDKRMHAKALARRLRFDDRRVLNRSRSLRKLVAELS